MLRQTYYNKLLSWINMVNALLIRLFTIFIIISNRLTTAYCQLFANKIIKLLNGHYCRLRLSFYRFSLWPRSIALYLPLLDWFYGKPFGSYSLLNGNNWKCLHFFHSPESIWAASVTLHCALASARQHYKWNVYIRSVWIKYILSEPQKQPFM